mmetsp:Transcript_21564/g.37117  ORF Transcript_21564/g.37117 Transcript_21564/m.37117 type:complete len:201 (-) Transcript_21564:112-714(-)
MGRNRIRVRLFVTINKDLSVIQHSSGMAAICHKSQVHSILAQICNLAHIIIDDQIHVARAQRFVFPIFLIQRIHLGTVTAVLDEDIVSRLCLLTDLAHLLAHVRARRHFVPRVCICQDRNIFFAEALDIRQDLLPDLSVVPAALKLGVAAWIVAAHQQGFLSHSVKHLKLRFRRLEVGRSCWVCYMARRNNSAIPNASKE